MIIMTSPSPSPLPPVLSLFRAFFCYVEPVMAVSGALLATVTPESFLHTILPLRDPATTIEVTPLVRYLLAIIAGLYCMLAVVQVILLRSRSHDSGLWRVVILGMLAGDLTHLGAIQIAVPGSYDIYWKLWTWRSEDWSNLGVLFLCVTMRLAYLLWSVTEDRKRRRAATPLPQKA